MHHTSGVPIVEGGTGGGKLRGGKCRLIFSTLRWEGEARGREEKDREGGMEGEEKGREGEREEGREGGRESKKGWREEMKERRFERAGGGKEGGKRYEGGRRTKEETINNYDVSVHYVMLGF